MILPSLSLCLLGVVAPILQLPASSCHLADIFPTMSRDEEVNAFGVVVFIAVLLLIGSGIWKNFQREPSAETETDRKISEATSNLEKRIEKKLDDLKIQIGRREDDIDTLRASMNKAVNDLNHATGRLEGLLEALKKQ